MAGRHSAKTSKKPIVIICIVAAVIIIGVICAVIFFNSGSKPANTTSTTTQQTTSTVQSTTVESAQTTLQPTESEQPTTQSETFAGETSEVSKVVVPPTQGGQEVSYFNATYVPYKAVDSSTNEECTLREVFGSAFSQGVITFNSDGTFTDSVTSSSANSGAYAVEGDKIVATYTNDKNMSVKVTSWEGDTPSELIINYGGYDVYFNM